MLYCQLTELARHPTSRWPCLYRQRVTTSVCRHQYVTTTDQYVSPPVCITSVCCHQRVSIWVYGVATSVYRQCVSPPVCVTNSVYRQCVSPPVCVATSMCHQQCVSPVCVTTGTCYHQCVSSPLCAQCVCSTYVDAQVELCYATFWPVCFSLECC